MKTIVIVALCALAFLFRLNMENKAMDSSTVAQYIHTQQTYSTELTIENDPEYSNFSAKVVATDVSLDRRVIVVGSADMNGQLASVRVGDTISVSGYLVELSQFQQYKKREHIVANFHVDSISDIVHSKSALDYMTKGLRTTIEKGCSRLDVTERGVCEGLLIGERNHIDKKTYDTYKKAQLTHLLVASGANIAFLVGFLAPLLKCLRVNARSFALITIAVFYCCATRFEPSIVRASVMVIIPAVAQMRGFPLSKARIFIGTIVACALIDPFLIYRVGFWLSVSATCGLYFVSPYIVVRVRSSILANTLSATLCVQPVLWIVFGFQAPVRWWASVIAVALAEPLSTVGMVLIVLISFLSPTFFLSKVLIALFHFGAMSLNCTARLGSSPLGYWLGWAFSIALVIAYTYRTRAKSKEGSVSVEQKCVLHYR